MGRGTSSRNLKALKGRENPGQCPANESSGTRECKERLRFETVLSDLSASFINLPAEQLDAAIENAQRKICECLDLDLSALWEWSAMKLGRRASRAGADPP